MNKRVIIVGTVIIGLCIVGVIGCKKGWFGSKTRKINEPKAEKIHSPPATKFLTPQDADKIAGQVADFVKKRNETNGGLLREDNKTVEEMLKPLYASGFRYSMGKASKV